MDTHNRPKDKRSASGPKDQRPASNRIVKAPPPFGPRAMASRHAEALCSEWCRVTGLSLPKRYGTRAERNSRWSVVSLLTDAFGRQVPVAQILDALDACAGAPNWRSRIAILRSRLEPKRATTWAERRGHRPC